MYSYTDEAGREWIACCECNRGGNGNDPDKCSCGWQCMTWNKMGCYLGDRAAGPIQKKKLSRSKERYRRYLECADSFNSFLDYCRWDGNATRN